jgi:hypothetical protein
MAPTPPGSLDSNSIAKTHHTPFSSIVEAHEHTRGPFPRPRQFRISRQIPDGATYSFTEVGVRAHRKEQTMSVKSRPCQRCGKEIPAERIEVLPQTRLCVDCSNSVGGEFDTTITPEVLSKEGSLKKNYGSFQMERTRKPIRRKDD